LWEEEGGGRLGDGSCSRCLGFHRGGQKSRTLRSNPLLSTTRPHIREGLLVIDVSALSQRERQMQQSDGCNEKRDWSFTVQSETDEPDLFAPFRWPGWEGSLSIFIGEMETHPCPWKVIYSSRKT
jgi:hypothetical protein